MKANFAVMNTTWAVVKIRPLFTLIFFQKKSISTLCIISSCTWMSFNLKISSFATKDGKCLKGFRTQREFVKAGEINSLWNELFTAAPTDQSNLHFHDFQSNGHKHTKLSYHYWIKLTVHGSKIQNDLLHLLP